MEPAEVSDTLDEASEIAEKHRLRHEHRKAAIKTRTAIYISVLAVVLAICHVVGSDASKEMLSSAIRASDTYAFYQAKTLRQTALRLSAGELDSIGTLLPETGRPTAQTRAEELRRQADGLETDANGSGRTQLLERAKAFEQARDRAAARDPYLDLAEALIQIAIVLASVFVIAERMLVLWLSRAMAVLGLLMLADGVTLLLPLPFL